MVAPFESDYLIGGRYRLERRVATGGMAEVWLALDEQLQRQVAVKRLKESIAKDPIVLERFRREAVALARLTHPNIVPVYDCVADNETLVVVMRYINGKSLRDILDERKEQSRDGKGTLTVHTTVHIGRSIAAALDKAHRENIVHRDIKPGNILMLPNGEVLLTDFGIAKSVTSESEEDLTSDNIMMGTAKYLSPEQVQGKPLDGRADIYALGLVLYECLAGRVPFQGKNDQETAVLRLQRDPTPLNGLCPDVPSTVISVIHRMMRRKPDNRFANGEEVARALESALAGSHDAITPVVGGTVTGATRDPLMAPTEHVDRTPSARNERTPSPRHDRTPPARNERPPRDVTPRRQVQPEKSLPRKQRTSVLRNYIPVATILVAAVVMGLLLWNGLQGTKSAVVIPPSASDVAVTGNARLVSVTAFDPQGDGVENNELVPNLTDGNASSTWSTVCYVNRSFGSKQGVGLVLALSERGIGTIKSTFAAAPYDMDIYTVDGDAPRDLEGWGFPHTNASSADTGAVDISITTPATHVLMFFKEIGRHPTCSSNNPFKGEIAEIQFYPTASP
jgi:eukaryotic-like serine/threonine-protein kinase